MPWSLQGHAFIDGPYQDYQIETTDGALTGYRIYLKMDFSTVREFYQQQLVGSGWTRGEDFSGASYWGFVWTKGSQTFLLVPHKNGSLVYTFLLSK